MSAIAAQGPRSISIPTPATAPANRRLMDRPLPSVAVRACGPTLGSVAGAGQSVECALRRRSHESTVAEHRDSLATVCAGRAGSGSCAGSATAQPTRTSLCGFAQGPNHTRPARPTAIRHMTAARRTGRRDERWCGGTATAEVVGGDPRREGWSGCARSPSPTARSTPTRAAPAPARPGRGDVPRRPADRVARDPRPRRACRSSACAATMTASRTWSSTASRTSTCAGRARERAERVRVRGLRRLPPRPRRERPRIQPAASAARLVRKLPPADVLICHCPPFGVNDDPEDPAHVGFVGAARMGARAPPAAAHARPHAPEPGDADQPPRRHAGRLRQRRAGRRPARARARRDRRPPARGGRAPHRPLTAPPRRSTRSRIAAT